MSKIKTEKPEIIKVGIKVTAEKIKTSLLCNSWPAFLRFFSLKRVIKCLNTKNIKREKSIQIINKTKVKANL